MCSSSAYSATPSSCTFASRSSFLSFFFFNDTATTEIYTLSLHDALPICPRDGHAGQRDEDAPGAGRGVDGAHFQADRKSTRLNSSHLVISYAVFCLKKNSNSIRPCRALRRSHPSLPGHAASSSSRVLPET